jgi:hypothetical protein
MVPQATRQPSLDERALLVPEVDSRGLHDEGLQERELPGA